MKRKTWKRSIDGYEDVGLCDGISEGDAICDLAAYEDTGLDPEEIASAIADAAKLISTMRNNKKAALWLKKYGTREAAEAALEARKC